MIDLREQDKLAIIRLAKQYLAPQTELWAYGSRVKGTAHPASDLDLVMVAPNDISNNLTEFTEALQDSTIPIIVQVFDWNFLPGNFKANVEQCYEVLVKV